MKTLIAAAPVVLAAMLSLSACNKQDAAANDTTTNEQVLNDEAPLDANAAGENAFAPDAAALNDTAAGNGGTEAVSNTQ